MESSSLGAAGCIAFAVIVLGYCALPLAEWAKDALIEVIKACRGSQ